MRLEEHKWRDADPEGMSFIDVDTPEAYAAALALYERLREASTGDEGGYSDR
jgi:hypothetical protein